MTPRSLTRLLFAAAIVAIVPISAAAQDRLCDPGNENCRAILINYIRNEPVAIDVAFWFMEDARYTNELIARYRAGVRVRVLIDTRANSSYPLNAQRLAELQAAGIPMRRRLTSDILHWKMMLFHGQNVVEFSGANYSADAWLPATATPYENYIDESIYFTSDPAIVNSFRTRFDDQWVSTSGWTNYANVGSLSRSYGVYPTDPSLNFVPWENYRTRAVAAYSAEQRKIDVIMYRITDRAHADAMLAATSRGIPVRLITEPEQYRDPNRMWHAWNVDRMYAGGVQIKHRAHQGLNHQKSVILYDQSPTGGGQPMVIFGSSNWTGPSASGQVEHNIFTSRPGIVSWFITQFERKWNNSGGMVENVDFVPLPPDAPAAPLPANGATNVGSSVRFTWTGGPWAHLYDFYLDTNPDPVTPVATDLAEGSSKTATSTFSYTYPLPLRAGTTYYWKVVAKTMALRARSSPVWKFTTAGCARLHADFDGDCRSDLLVFRPSTGEWIARTSASAYSYDAYRTYQWGLSTDRPVPADFDGDGRLDLVVYRPSEGGWYIRYSSAGYATSRMGYFQWGLPTDIPLSADFDGDRKADLVVYRPSDGGWYIRYSSAGYAVSRWAYFQWGLATDIPIAADFDADGRTDLAVYRPSDGGWYIRYSSHAYAVSRWAYFQWGLSTDRPLIADFDGDGRSDLVVYRPSDGCWYIRYSGSNYSRWVVYQWGLPTDIPVPSDFDGDGHTDLVVYRPSTGEWFVRSSSSAYDSVAVYQWGLPGDRPIGR